jgi:DNA-binding NarL/FixJ family response regulator
MAEPQQVLIVEDHPLYLEALRMLLEGEPWVGGIAEASSVEAAVTAADTSPPDLVVMDLYIPGGDGVEATRRIRAAHPGTKVLVLTMVDDADAAFRALRAGASGYLLKGSNSSAICDGLRTVAGGGVVLDRHIADKLLAAPQRTPASTSARIALLTSREREILTLLARGENTNTIASSLQLSVKTVRNHVSSIFAKLGVADRVQAVLAARDAGLVD